MISDEFTNAYENMEVLAKEQGQGQEIYDKLIVVVEEQIRLAKATVGNHMLPVVTSEERAAEDRKKASAVTWNTSSFMCEAKGVISKRGSCPSGALRSKSLHVLKTVSVLRLPIVPSLNPALPGIAANCQL